MFCFALRSCLCCGSFSLWTQCHTSAAVLEGVLRAQTATAPSGWSPRTLRTSSVKQRDEEGALYFLTSHSTQARSLRGFHPGSQSIKHSNSLRLPTFHILRNCVFEGHGTESTHKFTKCFCSLLTESFLWVPSKVPQLLKSLDALLCPLRLWNCLNLQN